MAVEIRREVRRLARLRFRWTGWTGRTKEKKIGCH